MHGLDSGPDSGRMYGLDSGCAAPEACLLTVWVECKPLMVNGLLLNGYVSRPTRVVVKHCKTIICAPPSVLDLVTG